MIAATKNKMYNNHSRTVIRNYRKGTFNAKLNVVNCASKLKTPGMYAVRTQIKILFFLIGSFEN